MTRATKICDEVIDAIWPVWDHQTKLQKDDISFEEYKEVYREGKLLACKKVVEQYFLDEEIKNDDHTYGDG